VYSIDWQDMQHCHNPNTERWDRSDGRIYRMQWQAAYKPVKVDLGAKSDLDLAHLLEHKNHWYGRVARRLLHERAQRPNGIARNAVDRLNELLDSRTNSAARLQALWALHLVNELTDDRLNRLLATESDPFARSWVIQLALEEGRAGKIGDALLNLAKNDSSPVVRRYLASAIQRVPEPTAWSLVSALAEHAEDKDDRNVPLLLWHGMATTWMSEPNRNLDRALKIAQQTTLPQLREWIYWFAATREGESLNRTVESLQSLQGEALHRRLAGLWLAMEPRANVAMPPAWNIVAPRLYSSEQPTISRLAERLAAAFGDASAFPRLRTMLGNTTADTGARQHAFAVLSRAQDRAALPVFVKLLDDDAFRSSVISLLARFDSPDVSSALVEHFASFKPNDRSATLDALTSRASFARALLDAIAAGKVPRDQLTAFHVTRLRALKNPEVDNRVATAWGRINQTPVEKQNQIAKLEKVFNEAPLWAFSANAGRQHFQKLCMQCHRIGNDGTRLGPELTGAGKHGVRYFLENVIDPDAVIGTDFQATTIDTKDDETVTGLVASETASAVTLRTTTGDSVIPKANIKERSLGQKSLMPEGLLDSLSEREQIELLKFLTTN
jgi:putative heme-binding domain-containing protein